LLLSKGSFIAGRMIELSVEGCRLRTTHPFTAGSKTRVEIAFRIHGIAFRFGGVIEWVLDEHLVGMRFLDVPSRSRVELSDVLLETEADQAAKAAKEAASGYAAQPLSESHFRTEEQNGQSHAEPEKKVQNFADSVPLEGSLQVAAGPQTNASRQNLPETRTDSASRLPHAELVAHHPGRDRRTQSRLAVDTSADILLINVGCHLAGRIQDLSVGGCRIHTDERFPVGIYTRVETEFRLQGLPFRLLGVIQAVHDQQRQLVGIRFLDMSTRKREQVEQLIKEIEEEQKVESGSESGNGGAISGEAMGA
jgi:hypothetical protein